MIAHISLLIYDCSYMPAINECSYMCVPIMQIHASLVGKANARKKRSKPQGKKKKKSKGKQKKTKKPLDKPSSMSDEVPTEDSKYTLDALLKSFEDPRTTLFVESLRAELKRRPELVDLKPEDGDRDPPPMIFGQRKQGYYKCRHLCRVYTIRVIK